MILRLDIGSQSCRLTVFLRNGESLYSPVTLFVTPLDPHCNATNSFRSHSFLLEHCKCVATFCVTSCNFQPRDPVLDTL